MNKECDADGKHKLAFARAYLCKVHVCNQKARLWCLLYIIHVTLILHFYENFNLKSSLTKIHSKLWRWTNANEDLNADFGANNSTNYEALEWVLLFYKDTHKELYIGLYKRLPYTFT